MSDRTNAGPTAGDSDAATTSARGSTTSMHAPDAPASERPSVRRADDVPAETVTGGTATRRQVLIGPEEGPSFHMRRFIMEPGGGMPRHTNQVEHEQYVLRGRATIGIGDEVRQVSRDDVVYIPTGMPHWYRAEGDEPFEFLCVVPNRPDRIEVC
jgi:quercetin dioxygenase-like cupin family protein